MKSVNRIKNKPLVSSLSKGARKVLGKALRRCSARAFTLLELLLVIAVIASLAGVILSALNPAGRLQSASDTKSVAKSNELKKAIQAYTLDNSGSLPPNILSLSTYGIYDVCKQGQSTNCVNLDILVTNGYLSEIPTDSDGASSVISGYKIEYDPSKTTVNTYSTDALTSYVQNGATLTKGLVGYWKMDENTGTTTTDSSGNNNTGTLTNGPTWTAGRYSTGINFDGTNDYLNLGTSNIGTNGTISLWFKQSVLLENKGLIGISTNGYFYLGSGPAISVFNGSSHGGSGVGIGDTGWHLGTLVWSGTYYRIYKDGVLDWQGTFSFPTQGALKAGVYPGSSNPLNGILDDIRVYNRALHTDEIAALYNYAPPAVAHWKLDEGTGTSAASSMGGNTLTFNGTPEWRTQSECISGNCVYFDGVNDYLSGSSVIPLNNYTVTAWIKPLSISGNIAWWEDETQMYLYNGNYQYRHFTGTSYYASSAATINKWTYVTAVQSPVNGISIYINGQLANTDSSAIANKSTSSFFLGKDESTPTFYGYIDDARVYNYVLTQPQIQKVMNNQI